MSERADSFVLYGRSGPHDPPPADPDFPVVGTVRYELHKALDGPRCCIKVVEVAAIFESREEARQWMLARQDGRDHITGQALFDRAKDPGGALWEELSPQGQAVWRRAEQVISDGLIGILEAWR